MIAVRFTSRLIPSDNEQRLFSWIISFKPPTMASRLIRLIQLLNILYEKEVHDYARGLPNQY